MSATAVSSDRGTLAGNGRLPGRVPAEHLEPGSAASPGAARRPFSGLTTRRSESTTRSRCRGRLRAIARERVSGRVAAPSISSRTDSGGRSAHGQVESARSRASGPPRSRMAAGLALIGSSTSATPWLPARAAVRTARRLPIGKVREANAPWIVGTIPTWPARRNRCPARQGGRATGPTSGRPLTDLASRSRRRIRLERIRISAHGTSSSRRWPGVAGRCEGETGRNRMGRLCRDGSLEATPVPVARTDRDRGSCVCVDVPLSLGLLGVIHFIGQ